FYGGGLDQLWRQAVGAFAVLIYSFVLTYIIGLAISKTVGFRIDKEDEVEGIDGVEHAESAYDFATAGGGGRSLTSTITSASAQSDAEARGVNA
ncbi:MAG: ammonium transporter, partial [Nocardioidaceae bacterium]